jgi:signal transduction histidine kinase/ligand-binding sensor domain-containing protein
VPLIRVLCVGVIALLWCDAVRALDRERTLAQIHFTTWTAREGAPSQISALAQTTDGYLWIGSTRGLFRFDGVQFDPYVPPPGVKLPSHNSYTLMATPDNGLWISFRPSGLGFLKDGQMTVYTRPDEIPRSQVYRFARDREGRIWAGTHDGLVLRQGNRWIVIGADWNLAPSRIRDLLVDRAGTLWVASDNGIAFLPLGTRRFQTPAVPVGLIRRITQDRNGRIWISEAGRGARPLPGTGNSNPEVGGDAQDLLFDRQGSLWIAEFREGVDRVRFPERLGNERLKPGHPDLEQLQEPIGLANNLLEDREGNIWISTVMGLARFRHSHLVPVKLPAHLPRFMTLLPGSDGDVWVGSAAPKPLLQLRGEEVTAHDSVQWTSSVYRDPTGIVWWGAHGGLWRQEQNRFSFFAQPPGTPDWIWEVMRADDDGLWVGLGDVGLVHFKNGVWTNRKPPPALPARVPSASYRDPFGALWLGYTGNRVCHWGREQIRCYFASDGLNVGRIRVIRGAGPHYWLGGELGLALFQNGRFRTINAAGNEPFGTVSGLIATKDGSLWLNEMRGVVWIAPSEVRLLLANPNHAVRYQRFDYLDGLPGAVQMNWTCSTAIEATDGRLWFATDNGLARIDPAHITRNRIPPPVSIRWLRSGDQRFTPAEKAVFPIDTQDLEIAYTAASLSIPERVRFRYKLEGADEQWRDAGTRREVFYTKLSPGEYRFRVIASNNDGLWNEAGASLAFSIPPAFYQTKWFIALCIAAMAGSIWLAYLMRMRQITARMQDRLDQRLDERLRIAQDLHDTLFQGFLSVSIQLHVATDSLPDESPTKPLLQRLLQTVRQVTEDGRRALRGLRPSDTQENSELEQAFSRVRNEVARGSAGDFRVVVSGRPQLLHPLIRDEVYRIGRESLVNAFQHAQAEMVEVELEYLPQNLRIMIRDDGKGIDADVLRSGRAGHLGLPGMRERAERIGARLSVSSRVGAGTEIVLIVPGRIAYRTL